jgi:hypothetical protein
MFQATGWILEEKIEENNADELILALVRPEHSAPQFKHQRADSM